MEEDETRRSDESRRPIGFSTQTDRDSALTDSETGKTYSSTTCTITDSSTGTSGPSVSASDTITDKPPAGLGEVQANEEGLGPDEGWAPPDIYISFGPDGEITVVDANGNPVDSPPNVYCDGDMPPRYLGKYPGGEESVTFYVTVYTPDLTGCTVHVGSDGKLTVVDESGKPLGAQPKVIQLGEGEFMVLRPNDSGVDDSVVLHLYSSSLDGCSVYIGQDGKAIVVDATGNPLTLKPFILKTGDETYRVFYPTADNKGQPTDLPSYSASLDGVYVHLDEDGNTTAVDANGKPLTIQPWIYKNDDGTYGVCYQSDPFGAALQTKLLAYTASLEGVSLLLGAGGNVTAVDANGNALSSQPIIMKLGDGTYRAFYPSADGKPTVSDLQLYSATLTGVYVHIDKDGNPTAVDGDGKPLAAQPVFTQNGDDFCFYASYGGGTPVRIGYYLPKSGDPKNAGSVWK